MGKGHSRGRHQSGVNDLSHARHLLRRTRLVMKVSRRKFLPLAATAAGLTCMSRAVWADNYPSRPVRLDSRLSRRHLLRHHRQADRAMAVRHGSASRSSWKIGRAQAPMSPPTPWCTPSPDGYSLLWVTQTNAINATLYNNLDFNFSRDIEPVACIIRVPAVMMVNPAVPAKVGPRVHRLRQGQSRQNQYVVARHRQREPYSLASCS